MNAQELYKKLDSDFEIDKHQDDWEGIDLGEFIFHGFVGKWMGLVLDNSENIDKVYASTFPSEKVITEILARGEKNILLFTHHPRIWDTKISGFPFKDISGETLAKMKEQNFSFYSLHVPLDKNGEYSTTVNLAKALDVEIETEFFDYYGVQVGIIGTTKFESFAKLAEHFQDLLGHEIGAWNYGADEIKDRRIALVAGGGNEPAIIKELVEREINVYVTGVANINQSYQPSVEFHAVAKENKINVLAGTHYSTEKFACMAMTEYFKKLGLPSEFITDEPDLGDIK